VAGDRPRAVDWFLICLKIGTLSFGGGGRALLFEEEVVERRRWLSAEEFREIFTLTQGLPGPNLLNICVYLGLHLVGWRGALAGLAALALPGAFAVVGVYELIDFKNRHVASFFVGMSIGSVAMIGMLCTKVGGGIVTRATWLKPLPLAKLGLAVAIAAAYAAGLTIPWVLALGAAGGIALELAS
jgi:chromate transporter